MTETMDEITIAETGGMGPDIKELAKMPLTKPGAWVTIMFKYQEMDEKAGDWGPIKYTIRRYQKRNGQFNQRSKFNITNIAQAEKVASVLNEWLEEDRDS